MLPWPTTDPRYTGAILIILDPVSLPPPAEAGSKKLMTMEHSDALVFFGATGDLAYKKIFPALQAMTRRGHLIFPS